MSGARSFNRRSLHHIGNGLNPYEQAISIIGKSLSAFDDDNLIPCYGFGDGTSIELFSMPCCYLSMIENYNDYLLQSFSATTHDQDVFSFNPDERFCHGFEEVLARYREIVPTLRLAGIILLSTVLCLTHHIILPYLLSTVPLILLEKLQSFVYKW